MKKILDINDNGIHLVCKKDNNPYTPYRLYTRYYSDKWHEILVDKYTDIHSVLFRINDIMRMKTQ